MNILHAQSLAVLQTLDHVLTAMDAEGVLSLLVAREIIASETSLRHKHRQSRDKTKHRITTSTGSCPSCGQPIRVMNVDGTTILACAACRYSELGD